jgi:hypothetical protein
VPVTEPFRQLGSPLEIVETRTDFWGIQSGKIVDHVFNGLAFQPKPVLDAEFCRAEDGRWVLWEPMANLNEKVNRLNVFTGHIYSR